MTHPGYAEVERNIEQERAKGRTRAGAVYRQMETWAGVNGADNLKWMLTEYSADAARTSTKLNQTKIALWKLLYALHARPMPGYELLPIEGAIAEANDLLDRLTTPA